MCQAIFLFIFFHTCKNVKPILSSFGCISGSWRDLVSWSEFANSCPSLQGFCKGESWSGALMNHRRWKALWSQPGAGLLRSLLDETVQCPAVADPRLAPGPILNGRPPPGSQCALTQGPRAQHGADREPHSPRRRATPTRLSGPRPTLPAREGADPPPPKGSPFRPIALATPPPLSQTARRGSLRLHLCPAPGTERLDLCSRASSPHPGGTNHSNPGAHWTEKPRPKMRVTARAPG